MSLARSCAVVALLSSLFATRSPAIPHSDLVDDSAYAWAYGWVVDSVTVSGNKSTKSFAVLREMQTQPGDVLERRILERDVRYLTDLSPIASVEIAVDSLHPGRCALRVQVKERAEIFFLSVVPVFKFRFDGGFTYGLKWSDKNFRGRIEQLTLSYERNEKDDEEVGFNWVAPWVGWHHVSVGGRLSYFNRGDSPSSIAVLERSGVGGSLAIPLTSSRISFSQLLGSVALEKSRTGAPGEPTTKEVTVSPSIGFRHDSRDSPIRPAHGTLFSLSVDASTPIDGDRGTSYRLRNETRHFRSLTEHTVLAGLSNFLYQFGDFPSFSMVRLGGSGTLRGHDDGRFTGFHRWFQSLEWRYQFLPRKVFRAPRNHYVDIGLAFVMFVDSGIVWEASGEFDLDRFHGTAGFGFRIYSPFQDVVRLDFGFSARGDARLHVGSGIRF